MGGDILQTENTILKVNINLLTPNKYQPRKEFDEKEIENLAESIKLYGILNPILVREKDGKYEIIAGERRFRAAKLANLQEVPVIVKIATDQEIAEMALIENVQRRDLSPIEEAKSYEEIIKLSNQTQNDLAKKLGKSQSFIANKIRLLSLPKEIQEAIIERKISERHARSLLSVEDETTQIELLNRIIEEKLTVKETEQIINEKEITEDEIKQAINDIMKSLNIDNIDIEEKEEKEDDNMNNGNFFPSYDNSMNNNTSLNMMNMQSMGPANMEMQNDMVMPTPPNIISSPMSVTEPQMGMNTLNPMDMSMPQPLNMNPVIDNGYQNHNSFINPQVNMNTNFNPEPIIEPTIIEPYQSVLPQENTAPMQDTPLFNPSAFEVPVTIEPLINEQDKLTKLEELLKENGYTYKVYSNNTDDCVIIELPRK